MKSKGPRPKRRESASLRKRAPRMPRGDSEQVRSEKATEHPHKNVRLDEVRQQWLCGEWDGLRVHAADLVDHPDRGKIAILAASAYQHLGDRGSAKDLVSQALAWGCDHQMVARILVSDVHNSLACVAALAGNAAAAREHFREAVKGVSGDEHLACQARSVRELRRLGLLAEAANVVNERIQQVADRASSGQQPGEAQISILRTQIELLRNELSLAQQRGQLARSFLAGGERQLGDSASVTDSRAELERRSVSQLGQDIWVLERTNFKRGGFFVEFGATDGVLLSNSWLLEKEFGWVGICAEPNPLFFERLRKNRSCVVSSACIGAESGRQVEFVFADEYGGIADFIEEDMHAEKRQAYRRAGKVSTLITVSLNDFLEQQGAPRNIDYLSIDTEGNELDILATFPFERWRIELVSVEHNYSAQRAEIRQLMSRAGYQVKEAKWDDWFYLG